MKFIARMNGLVTWIFLMLITSCTAQEVGRVFIGNRGSNVTVTSFTFTESTSTATIPVYIEAFASSNLSTVVNVIGNVRVTCSLLIDETGYTTATFSSFTASNANKDSSISVSNLGIGRQNSVQCYGESQQAGITQFTRTGSISPALPFTMNSNPAFTLYPSQITTRMTSFSMLLILDAASDTGTVGIRCQADMLNDTQQVNDALQNPLCFTSSPTPTPATGNATAPSPTQTVITPGWNVLEPTLQLAPSNGQYFAKLRIVRNRSVTSITTEYVVVSCCSDNLGLNISDTVFAVASLKPNVTVNWNLATDVTSDTVERTIQNPAYLEVAPCACDLTSNLCDIGCCCDTDCTSISSVASSCIPGLYGGQSAPTPEYSCHSNYFNKEDWFPLMCVQFEYNSLLGFFYSNEVAIRKEENFNEKVAGEEYYSYTETETRSPGYNTLGRDGYRYGSAVQSIVIDNTRVESIGIIALPQRILSGECLSTAPIQYMKDVSTDCTYQLTRDLCSLTSTFNSRFYVLSTSANNPAFLGSYGILDSPANQRISVTNVNYHCATDLTGYIKSTAYSYPTVSSTTSYTFNYTLPTGNCEDSCGNDICATSQASVSQDTALPRRCSWNDGVTLPPEVLFNSGSNTCENAVIDVRYQIYWSGTQITRLDAIIILANIGLVFSPVVSQKFEAVFTHDISGNTTGSDNYLRINTTYARSGSPGYDFEKSIWSGVPVYNSTTNEFINIDTNTAGQIAVWNTGVDGLCYNAGRRTVMFGEDTFTSCNLRIGLNNFLDCNTLRKLIINRVNNLMPSLYLGRYGYNDPYNINYWISIQREDLTDICLQNYNETDEDILTYSMTGMCTNIITGINLDIMYAETGQRNGYPIHEIIGASISYPKSTWKLTCSAGGACSTSTGIVESFPVTSTVQFTKVPGNTPARLEKWEEDYDRSLCGQDICWEELLYPLSSSYTAESRNYVLAVTLVLILIFIGYLFITRPWW